ncbi:hypothetical protein [Bradyrhizobium guangdongense]|uniref:hypothetical protein n=1 Tax=Bradyrhizobium guangdongense TaxID=1325090 RepID=UPI00131A26FC|nr:hypothetical protein [Bradyrhizobium guangdongense]
MIWRRDFAAGYCCGELDRGHGSGAGQVNPLRLHVAIVVARSAGPELILIQVKNADQTADSNIYRNQSLRPQIGGDVSILSSS